jgi:hypothetical protein
LRTIWGRSLSLLLLLSFPIDRLDPLPMDPDRAADAPLPDPRCAAASPPWTVAFRDCPDEVSDISLTRYTYEKPPFRRIKDKAKSENNKRRIAAAFMLPRVNRTFSQQLCD